MCSRVRFLLVPVLVALVVLLSPSDSFAQVTAGASIFGTITDPTGAAIPDAEVKVISTSTGLTRVVRTGAEGNYVVQQLTVDTYDIEVSLEGFNVARVTDVLVQTNETIRRSVELTLGAVTETVEVIAAAELTNTYTSQLSQTVDSKRVVELPLNGRDVTQLSLTVAGASVTDRSTAFYAGTSGLTPQPRWSTAIGPRVTPTCWTEWETSSWSAGCRTSTPIPTP